MTEEHKQKIRDAHAARKDRLAAEAKTAEPRLAAALRGDVTFTEPGESAPLSVVAAVPAPAPVVIPAPVVPGFDPATPGGDRTVKYVVPAPAPVTLTPRQSFSAWLHTNGGKNSVDPRFSSDYGRMLGELEDRLFAAYEAGWKGGRGE